jgi:hypothetical protein
MIALADGVMRFLVEAISFDEGIALMYVDERLPPTAVSSDRSLVCTGDGVGETPVYPKFVSKVAARPLTSVKRCSMLSGNIEPVRPPV